MKEFKNIEFRKDIPNFKRKESLNVSLDPTGFAEDRMLYKFSKIIFWKPIAQTKMKFLYNNSQIRESIEYSDYYGYLSCIETGLERIEKEKENYKITENSELTLELDLEVVLVPTLLSHKKHCSDQYFEYMLEIPTGWFTHNKHADELFEIRDLSERIKFCDNNNCENYLKENTLIEKTIYSTKGSKNIVDIELIKKEIEKKSKELFIKIDSLK